MVGKNSDLKIGKRRKAVTHGHFEAKKNPYVLDTSERIAGALYIYISTTVLNCIALLPEEPLTKTLT